MKKIINKILIGIAVFPFIGVSVGLFIEVWISAFKLMMELLLPPGA